MWQLPPTNISVGSLVGKIVALTIHHLLSISVPFIFLSLPRCGQLTTCYWSAAVFHLFNELTWWWWWWFSAVGENYILESWWFSCVESVYVFFSFSFPVLGWNKGRGITVALKCSKYKHPGEGPTLHPGIDYSMRWSGLIWRNHSSHNYFILYCSWMVSKLVSGAGSLAHFPCKIKLLALCSGMNTGLLM